MDDIEQLRRRMSDAVEKLSALHRKRGTATTLVQIKDNGSMPTTNPGVYACKFVNSTTREIEADNAVFTPYGNDLCVTVIGSKVPLVGDVLPADLINGRWVAERYSTPTPTPTNGCTCTYPTTWSCKFSVSQATAAFYFNNSPAGGFPEPVYTLTYGARPADIPLNLQLLWFNYPNGVADPYFITMPANGWFSPPIAGFVAGAPTSIYFYGWVKSCTINVMVIDAPYGGGAAPGATRGAGNNVINYLQLSCTPFSYSGARNGNPVITATHGGDDLIQSPGGDIGMYTNPRVGL